MKTRQRENLEALFGKPISGFPTVIGPSNVFASAHNSPCLSLIFPPFDPGKPQSLIRLPRGKAHKSRASK